MKLSKLLILGLLSSLTLIGCNVKKESSSASESSSIVSVSESSEEGSEVESSESEEPVVEYTAAKVCEDFNAALAAEGYGFAAEWDAEYEEYWLGVGFGASTDDSEENLGSAAYTLASFLPEYMIEDFGFYDDPTSEDFYNILGANIACYYISFTSEDELSSATVVSYIYSGNLSAQISIFDNAE